jgi:succinate dehydrogenase / fumarate reductase iron-sulfur subunit
MLEATPTAIRGLLSGKVTPQKALFHKKLPDQKQVRRIFHEIHDRDDRIELNLYIVGEGEGEPEEMEPRDAESGAQEEKGAMSEGGQES